MIGLIGSACYIGFMAGCLTVPALVGRVGHIRVFGVLASSGTAALFLVGIHAPAALGRRAILHGLKLRRHLHGHRALAQRAFRV